MNPAPTAPRTGLRYQAALRMLFRAARRQRYGLRTQSVSHDHPLFGRVTMTGTPTDGGFSRDDRRRLRNARKAERRAS